ncbi:MAG: transglycosylase SLT domain-containing protein [Gemmatimonadetes bacterium]|nr:transglycosylase SLT domain-containing protein [Gemmatimonadota bacterium]MBI2403429.1 transglycosylase SLT domain-containing protein [Gemmatimonadota bacterium]
MTAPTLANQATGRGPRLTATQVLMLRGLALFVACLLLVSTVRALAARGGTGEGGATYTGTAMVKELTNLRSSLDRTSGELELMQLELQRARALLDLSSRYQVPSDLVALIYDTALREGLDPDLAFRLVKVESYFNPRATSSAQAIGLAQVQLRTARFYQPGITLKRLYDPATNLTIGFRYLHDLIDTYQGDLRLALLAYNRGPAKVNQLLGVGQEPGNGYASSVLSPTASRRR